MRGGRDTGAAKLPGLPSVSTGNASLDAWITAATERLEVREGQRGNAHERAVTQRELKALTDRLDALQETPDQAGLGDAASIVISVGGMTATMAIKKFEDALRATKLYQDMKKRLDDPTRFNDLRSEVREELLRDLRQLAQEQGAKVEHVERIITDMELSLALKIATVTAAAEDAAAGLRELDFAAAELGRAQAGKITQLEASLGNYYQDGTTGRANLEESMTVTADRLSGLEGQYTLKVQAGGSIAGFGLAATEKNGKPDSAFIVAADKFAVVNPKTWSAGLTNTPDASHIPFGVDAGGIYLNHNVYVKGNMRVDTAGKRLIDGLRGSLDVNGGTDNWSDNVARNAIWKALGNTDATSSNNHLVIGDMVTIGSVTKQWMGSRWDVPGIVISGNMLVNGSVAAGKIDTRGLDIRDASGNVILSAGTNLAASRISGAVNIASSAENSQVSINGTKISATELVSRLNKIGSGNISTFMQSAAISNAYIGNAAVDTLKIKGQSVSVPHGVRSSHILPGKGNKTWLTYVEMNASLPYAGKMFVYAVAKLVTNANGWVECGTRLLVNGNVASSNAIDTGYFVGVHVYDMSVSENQKINIKLQFYGFNDRNGLPMKCGAGSILALGVMR